MFLPLKIRRSRVRYICVDAITIRRPKLCWVVENVALSPERKGSSCFEWDSSSSRLAVSD